MNLGPRLVIKGTFMGSLFVCGLLFLITAGVTFPPPKVAKAIEGQAEVVGISVSTDSVTQPVPVQNPRRGQNKHRLQQSLAGRAGCQRHDSLGFALYRGAHDGAQ